MNYVYHRYVKDYQKTPKGRYIRQKANANRRGIEWYLTFEEWWDIWQKSGKWDQRGCRTGQYCMSRNSDYGPYRADNVEIKLIYENTKEGNNQRKARNQMITMDEYVPYERKTAWDYPWREENWIREVPGYKKIIDED